MARTPQRGVPDPSQTLPQMRADALWSAAHADLLNRAAEGDAKYVRNGTPSPPQGHGPRRWNADTGAWEDEVEHVPDPGAVTNDYAPASVEPARFDFPDVVSDVPPAHDDRYSQDRLLWAAAALLLVAAALGYFVLG